jgi:hypothetical protein
MPSGAEESPTAELNQETAAIAYGVTPRWRSPDPDRCGSLKGELGHCVAGSEYLDSLFRRKGREVGWRFEGNKGRKRGVHAA